MCSGKFVPEIFQKSFFKDKTGFFEKDGCRKTFGWRKKPP